MDHRRLPRRAHQPCLEPIVLTPADLHTARLELAADILAPLLEASPALPVRVRQRLAPLLGQIQRLVPVVRQAEADQPPGRG
jgi:hypothetical protein